MKKTNFYAPPGFKFEVWNDKVRLTFQSDGRIHTRSELITSWKEINEKCLDVLAGVPEPETPNAPDVSLQKTAPPLDMIK